MKTQSSPAPGLAARLARIAALTVFAAPVSAQTTVTWSAAYLDPSKDTLAGVVRDAQGRSFVAGTTTNVNVPVVAFVRAYDPSGGILWTQTVTTALNGWNDIALGPNGRIAVAGVSRTTIQTNDTADFLVAEYDAAGNQTWITTWNGPASRDDVALGVAFDPLGRVVVGGYTVTSNSVDGVVVAFDATGQLAWATQTAIAMNDLIFDIAVDGAGTVFAMGGDGIQRTYLTRFESTGALGWKVTRDLEQPAAITTDAVGGVHVAGRGGPASGPRGFYLLCLAGSNGGLRFQRIINEGFASAGAEDVVVTPFGDVVATGTMLSSVGDFDAFTVAWNTAGTELWRHRIDFGSNRVSFGRALALGAGGDVTMVGEVSDVGGANPAPLAAHYARGIAPVASWEGTLQPLAGFTVQGAYAVAANEDGGVTIAGTTSPSSSADVVTWSLAPLAQLTCFGDDTGSACPCGNASTSLERAGCVSSLGVGARLDWSGNPSLANDGFTLRAAFIGNAPALFFQGSTAIAGGAVFGDGLLCAGGAIVRLGVKFGVQGSASYPEPGDASVSVAGQVAAAGTSHAYQLYYRDAASFCTSATFNLTNAVTTVWQP